MSAATTGTASTAAGAAPAFAVRKGVRRWLHGYRVMLRWELGSLRLQVPLIVAIQILAGAGFAVGIGLYRQLPRSDAMYLASGTAVITLVLIGMVLEPQLITQQKTSGAYEFLWSLPLPRTAAAAASLVDLAGGEPLGLSVLLELTFLGGRDRVAPLPVHSLLID